MGLICKNTRLCWQFWRQAQRKEGGEGEMKGESMDVSVSKDVKILSNGQH